MFLVEVLQKNINTPHTYTQSNLVLNMKTYKPNYIQVIYTCPKTKTNAEKYMQSSKQSTPSAVNPVLAKHMHTSAVPLYILYT